MPVPYRPPSPLQNYSSMNDERRLPPITTQLADYFPRARPKTPPRTPDAPGALGALKKRKLSFDRGEAVGNEVQARWKRSMTESSGAWPRPASNAHANPEYGAPSHRNSIAIVPPARTEYRPQPLVNNYEQQPPLQLDQKSLGGPAEAHWPRDPPLFKLPSPTKPNAEGRPYETKPQPVHIGENSIAPLSALNKPRLSQPFQYTDPKSASTTHDSSSARESHQSDAWRTSSSSKSSASADGRHFEFPSNAHRWTFDTGAHRPLSKLDESPRSPRDRRGGGSAGGFESSHAPPSASTERSHSDSRYGPASVTSPSTTTTNIPLQRRDSHLLLESPQSSRYQQPPPLFHPQKSQPPYNRSTGYDAPPPDRRQSDFAGGPLPPHPLRTDFHHHSHAHHYDMSPTTPRHHGQHSHHHQLNSVSTGIGPPGSAGASEGRSQYTWEVPGMTGDHVHRKRRGNLPKESTSILNAWFSQHTAYPYPKEEEKQRLQAQTGLTMSQISNWFINARRRRRPSIAAANEENWLKSPTSGRRRTRS